MQGLSVSKMKYEAIRKITTEGSGKQNLGLIMRRPNKTIPIHAKGGSTKYQMTTKNRKTVSLQVVTMIDPATCWIEIRTVPSTCANLVSNIVELG